MKKIITTIILVIMIIMISGCKDDAKEIRKKPLIKERPEKVQNIEKTDSNNEIDEVNEAEEVTEKEPDIRDRSLVVNDIDQSEHYKGDFTECKEYFMKNGVNQTWFNEFIDEDINDGGVLYFILGSHSCDERIVDDQDLFEKGSTNLIKMAQLLSGYNGKISMQVSKKYAEWAKELGDTSLKQLAEMGSEIAMHSHLDYLISSFMGKEFMGVAKGEQFATSQTLEVWMNAYKEYKKEVEELSGTVVTGMSGDPDYEYMNTILPELGITERFDYKNKETRMSDERLFVLNPWRPAGVESMDSRAQYDRNGSIIFIPEGVHPAHCKETTAIATPYSYGSFDFVTTMLRASLKEVDPTKINTFSVMFHPWDAETEADWVIWKEWLDTIIKPLVDSGKLKFATYGEIAEMYEEWENENVK
ncbi:hypothetical protein KKF04_05795 [Patescibacteria group bacterium]|nr:hypothetical protein [Patescibacteria group bacterium]